MVGWLKVSSPLFRHKKPPAGFLSGFEKNFLWWYFEDKNQTKYHHKKAMLLFCRRSEKRRDYSICEKIPQDARKDYRYRCIKDVARRKGECGVIPEQMGRDYCYLYQFQSIMLMVRDNRCDIYKEPRLADLCVRYLQGQVDKNTLCSPIVNQGLQQECLYYNMDGIRVNYRN